MMSMQIFSREETTPNVKHKNRQVTVSAGVSRQQNLCIGSKFGSLLRGSMRYKAKQELGYVAGTHLWPSLPTSPASHVRSCKYLVMVMVRSFTGPILVTQSQHAARTKNPPARQRRQR